jgi:phage shock protein A
MTLQQLAARIDTLKANLATAAEGLRSDIQNLKAEIEALRAQITDPAQLAAIDAAVTQLEGTVSGLTELDSETPATPAPGTPA